MKTRLQPQVARRGFTLVELMVGTVVLGLLIGGVMTTMITTSRMMYRNMAEADINQSVRFLEAQLGRDVRSARTMTVSNTGMLTLKTPGGDIDYFLEKNAAGALVLTRRDQAGGWSRMMLGDIFDVTFTIPEYSVNQVHMRVDAFTRVGGGRDVERTFHSRFTSRVANFYRF